MGVLSVLIIVPAVCRKQEGHHEVHFAVRRAVVIATGATVVTLPRKVAVPVAALVPHVVLGPFPELVEFFLVVRLHGNHHAVGHAFGTDVVVVDVLDVAFVTLVVKDLGIFITLEVVIPKSIHFFLDFFIGLAQVFRESAGVIARIVGTTVVLVFVAVRAVVGTVLVEEFGGYGRIRRSGFLSHGRSHEYAKAQCGLDSVF